MHFRTTLKHSHACADGPVMDQVKCRVQLQHCSTISWARRLERLTIELVPNSPVGVFPFLFRPPDGPAAVDNIDTPPAISWPSLLRSDIAVWLSYQELTPLAHSRRPLALRMPHVDRGVCVTNFLLSFYATPPIPTPSVFPPPSVPQLYADSVLSLAIRRQPLASCPASLTSSLVVCPVVSP